jgi:hypothetical protein
MTGLKLIIPEMVDFLPEAEEEMIEAAIFYQNKQGV